MSDMNISILDDIQPFDKTLGFKFRANIGYTPKYVNDVRTITIAETKTVLTDIETSEEIVLDNLGYEEIENNIISKTIELTVPRSISNTQLQQGKRYSIKISFKETYDDEWSVFSEELLILCLTKPVFKIANLKDGDIVDTTEKKVIVYYSQEENEMLDTFELELFDNKGNLFESSGKISYSNQDYFTFQNLENEKEYMIELNGTTCNGLYLTCDIISFTVDFVSLKQSPILIATNIREQGCIELKTNIISFECKFYDDTKADFNNEKLNIYEDNYLDYFKGLSLNDKDNFSLFIKFEPLNNEGKIISFDYDNTTLSILDVFGTRYYELKTLTSVVYKEVKSNNVTTINITRQNGLYDFKIC